jgi:hypothetical protein
MNRIKSEKQKRNIELTIQALIFSACSDVCADWNKINQEEMLKLAEDLFDIGKVKFDLSLINIPNCKYEDKEQVKRIRKLLYNNRRRK